MTRLIWYCYFYKSNVCIAILCKVRLLSHAVAYFRHLVFFFQINVQHPAAKSMLEVARTQDEETGDGTTSVIILGKSVLMCKI